MPPTPSSPPPNLAARFAGTCGSCGKRYDVGERIAKDATTGKWAHAWCLHGDLFRSGSAVAASSSPDGARCAATTKAGRPCANAPQKGERYCGPHLDTPARTPSPAPSPSPLPARHETVAERAEREGWEPF